ncbi:MAG: peptidylprolyl isomerase [Deltaproteobacteria bacterium]|nr:peptidylprolyl isomerase [Deltaproteobacteria bacterium]
MNSVLPLFFAIAATTPATKPSRVLLDRIVAVVNDDVILASELESAAAPFRADDDSPQKAKALDKDILEQLIYERLLGQQIKEAKIDASDEEVDRAIEDILKQNNITLDDLKAAVKARGRTMGQYKEDIKSQLVRLKIVDMKVRSKVSISDAEIEAEFTRRFGDEKPEALLQIRHIFLRYGDNPSASDRARVLKAATKAYERVKAGEDFAEVAKEVSQGPTAASGGDLGELTESGLLPELARALKGLEVGRFTEPVVTSNGVHIVRLDGRRPGVRRKFEAERNKIYQELYQREVERQMKVWLDEVRAESAIELRG